VYEQNKDYEDRVNLGMIPFYLQRLNFINEELISVNNPPSENDRKFLNQVYNEVNEKFKNERSVLNDLANKIYDTWVEIKDVRSKQGYRSTPLMLKVHKVESQDGNNHESIDHFSLNKVNPTDRKDNGEALGWLESKRRNDINNLKVQANLIING